MMSQSTLSGVPLKAQDELKLAVFYHLPDICNFLKILLSHIILSKIKI